MRKLTGDNLKVAWAGFSTYNLASFSIMQKVHGVHSRPHLKLENQRKFCPVCRRFNPIISRLMHAPCTGWLWLGAKQRAKLRAESRLKQLLGSLPFTLSASTVLSYKTLCTGKY